MGLWLKIPERDPAPSGDGRNNRLSIKVTPQNLGDPTPGVSKTLIVDYRYQNRQQNVKRVEGEMLILP